MNSDDINKRKIERESAELTRLMLKHLLMGTNDAIISEEKHGQQELVESTTLPTDLKGASRETLEAAGVKFLEVVPDDPIFQYVQLPEGWKLVPTHSQYWSDLTDEKGRVRAAVFYKAVSYDRHCHLIVTRRFDFHTDYDEQHRGVYVAYVTDGPNEIYRTSIEVRPDFNNYDVSDKKQAEAKQWLDEHYPGWDNPTSYWS